MKMVNKFSYIKERVVHLIELKKLKKDPFFKKIGMTSANFRGEPMKTPLNSNAIEHILSEFPDVRAEWLITGKGNIWNETPEGTKEPGLIEFLKQEVKSKDEVISELNRKVGALEGQLQIFLKNGETSTNVDNDISDDNNENTKLSKKTMSGLHSEYLPLRVAEESAEYQTKKK